MLAQAVVVCESMLGQRGRESVSRKRFTIENRRLRETHSRPPRAACHCQYETLSGPGIQPTALLPPKTNVLA